MNSIMKHEKYMKIFVSKSYQVVLKVVYNILAHSVKGVKVYL